MPRVGKYSTPSKDPSNRKRPANAKNPMKLKMMIKTAKESYKSRMTDFMFDLIDDKKIITTTGRKKLVRYG